MPVIPYLNFNGNAKDALQFYQDVFQIEPAKTMTYQDMPGASDLPDYMKPMILHAEFQLYGSTIYAADTPNDGTHPYLVGNQVSLTIQLKSLDESKTIYEKLAQNGVIYTPFGPTFFSPGYAEFSDQFHVRWMLITE